MLGRVEKSLRGVGEGRLLAAYLAVLGVVGLVTVGEIGVTWDEPNYFTSSYSYLSWFGHGASEPSALFSSIDRFWEQSHEAPPFLKLWAGLFAGFGALVFGTEDLGRLGDAYRMGSYVLFLASVYVAFRFVRRELGPAAAWGAALSLPLVPVLFGFARLGQLDGAAASMYLISSLALYGALRYGGRGRTALAGALLGLAFATKLSVFPLPFAAFVWVLVYGRGELRAAVVRLAAACGVGAVVFYAIWPWMWPDPVGRTGEFLFWAGGLQDERLTFYLGEWWAGAPFHYPLAALVALVPLAVAAAGVAGVVRLLGSGHPAAGWLLLHLGLLLAVAGSGLVPIYGGPRQFLAAFPLWAVCAGVGVGWAASRAGRPALFLAAYVALSLPGILWTGTENSLEYYGEAVGLLPGARALGFETTYLANTYKPAVEYVSEVAPEGATVYTQAGTYAVLESYRRTGDLREDLRPAYLSPIAPERYVWDEEPREDSYFLFLPRQSIYTDQMLALERRPPLWEHTRGGVPLVKVYSGEAVGETLGVEGELESREPGLLNAALAGGLFLLVPFALLRAKQHQGEERDQE